MEIYQKHCQQKKKSLKNNFDLAASYIIHGEYNNMREQLLIARAIARNTACQKSIEAFLN